MSPQSDLDDDLDYHIYFRASDSSERDRAASGGNFGLASAQRYANEARHSRLRGQGSKQSSGMHRRGGKKFFS